MSEHERDDVTKPPRKRKVLTLLSFNSKRLTTVLLKQLARAMSVPTAASSDDFRQLISGKLEELGKEPMNVQVVLRDVEGGFLEAEPIDDDLPEDSPGGGGSEEGESAAVARLREALMKSEGENAALQEVERLKQRLKDMWQTNCKQLAEFDDIVTSKEDETASLKEKLHSQSSMSSPPPSVGDLSEITNDILGIQLVKPQPRRGKARSIDHFTGENPEIRLDDWLPSLRRAAEWNGWCEKEQLIQLAGHLRGRALQEWNLLSNEQLGDLDSAVKMLKERLDPGSKVLAGQDFRHTTQGEAESVADFIRRLE